MTTQSPTKQPRPCGTWPSTLSPEAAASGAVSLSYAGAANGTLYWIEGRPAERGRSALVARAPAGSVTEPLAPEANVRSRVHEYGGLPWAVVGGRVVYSQFSDQRMYVVDPGGAPRPITLPGTRHADLRPAPGGRHVYAVREDHRPGSMRNGQPVNAVVRLDVDAQPGEGDVLFDGSDFVAWPTPSPDGTRLAFVAWDHPAMPWDNTRLLIGRLEGGALLDLHTVAGGPDHPGESVLDPQWGNDGTLYFLSDRSGWWNLQAWRGGAVQPITQLDAEIGRPMWNLGLRSYVLGQDEQGHGFALLRVGQGGRDQLMRLNLDSGRLTPLPLPFVELGEPGLLDAHTAFVIGAPVDGPPALVTVDLRRGAAPGAHQVVRAAGQPLLPPPAVSRAEAIAFPTQPGADGQARNAHAWFYPPCHPEARVPDGERPPLIVILHGGPTACAGPAFKTGVQFWTSRGFAVVDVNYGGSTGHGREYRQRLLGQWGVVDLQDAVAAVDFLAAQGRIDGDRVAIRGGSAGGFTVLSALAFTQRFAAGINYFGVADLETLAADTHKFESRYLDSLVAPLPEGRDVYRQRSPTQHMAQCRAALLTLQGSDDKAVPPQQSRDITQAARSAGCPVAYLEFEGEGHGIRQAANLVRAMQAELVFLGRVFGYTPAEALPPLAIDNEAALPSR